MICKHCGRENAPLKKTCAYCGKMLSGHTINNVTGKTGYRTDTGEFIMDKGKHYKNHDLDKRDDELSCSMKNETLEVISFDFNKGVFSFTFEIREKNDVLPIFT